MTFYKVLEKLQELKKSHKVLHSNIVFSIPREQEVLDWFMTDTTIVFSVEMYECRRAYFATSNVNDLLELLGKLCKGTVIEYVYNVENELQTFLVQAGLTLYATYVRITTKYLENPYSIPETGNRKQLEELYDPSLCQYPSVEDAEELDGLLRRNFDVIKDRLPSIEQWRDIIKRKEVLIHKEDNRIVTLYVWKQEGRKLYSNLSFNMTSANYLYNLERHVIESMWNKGIHIHYAWYNIINEKAIKKENANIMKVVDKRTYMYKDYFLV